MNNSTEERPEQSATDSSSLTTQTTVKIYTYEELYNFHESSQLARGLSLTTLNNHQTALRFWIALAPWTSDKERGPDEVGDPFNVPISDEFGADFERHRVKYVDSMPASTKTDRKSIISQIRKSWLDLLNNQHLPKTFGAALRFLNDQERYTTAFLAKKCGLEVELLSSWLEGNYLPSYKDLGHIATIERLFDLPPCTLVNKLPKYLLGVRTAGINSQTTPYRVHVTMLMQKPYHLNIKSFTLVQQEEWEQLLKFYTNHVWVAAQGLERHRKGWRTRKNNGKNSTAVIKLNFICSFYGFLSLPAEPADPELQNVKFDPNEKSHQKVRGLDPHLTGKGLNPKNLSLAQFTDVSLISDMLGLLKARSRTGAYNSHTKNFLAFCAQLTRPEKGFLWQFPDYGRRAVPSIMSVKKWRELCATSHRRISNIITNIENSDDEQERFSQTRDTNTGVVRPLILAREHPITALTDIAEGFRRDVKLAERPELKAYFFRNMVMTELLASNPMRAINIAEMRYLPGAKGLQTEDTNLYKLPDGNYRLKYEAHELKNGAIRGRYDLPVNPVITVDLDEYFSDWRPLLEEANQCYYVFRPEKNRSHRRRKDSGYGEAIPPIRPSALSRILFRASQIYLAPCPGFRLHAARHFVASEYLKHNPGGYKVAATVLHDSEEMVRDTYSWVTPNDIIPFWNNHLTPILQKARKEAT